MEGSSAQKQKKPAINAAEKEQLLSPAQTAEEAGKNRAGSAKDREVKSVPPAEEKDPDPAPPVLKQRQNRILNKKDSLFMQDQFR